MKKIRLFKLLCEIIINLLRKSQDFIVQTVTLGYTLIGDK